ncbi:MAG: Preprotein translocase, SecE subunit [Candidatus Nomurabacteria bacterium GW2011_GWA1_46_11]|uniref:Protein translocase subunit SecE n=2 Tax=Candidatus Nomuraibacteriota TaxID=1752729 RepID=A0A0G1W056_9BACT|nr:MAG: Preprotein translocase, SecE subunit [Candidatus Nomurabacteria bacterium GW2011_GWA1_46_11]KKU75690.1 MAG: Preprotein translocase, SecE subunit [Candidatus Nomurabacteria bacterium GW2011_GWB1_47_6]
MTIIAKESNIKRALRGAFLRGKTNVMSSITEYLKETRTELKHVIWPSRSQTFYYTLIVILLSVVVAYYLGVFDYLFSLLLGRVIAI